MSRICIIYTTFLRDKLIYKTLKSILDNWNKDYILLIADQGEVTSEKINNLVALFSKYRQKCCSYETGDLRIKSKKIYYYQLPLDCGLSYARNYLVKKAEKLRCKYCLLTADSLLFTEKYEFKNIIKFLKTNTKNGLIGFHIRGRISWERNIKLVPGKYFSLVKTKLLNIVCKNISYKPCEICRNFFLAKTKCLKDVPWDENLKMTEHEDEFYRLKLSGWKVYFTDVIKCNYEEYKPKQYNHLRIRCYNEFLEVLRKKWNITGWQIYEQ